MNDLLYNYSQKGRVVNPVQRPPESGKPQRLEAGGQSHGCQKRAEGMISRRAAVNAEGNLASDNSGDVPEFVKFSLPTPLILDSGSWSIRKRVPWELTGQ